MSGTGDAPPLFIMSQHIQEYTHEDFDRDDEAVTLRRPGAAGTRVLVADDDEEMRSLVAAMLVGDGFEVMEVPSGSDAVEALESISAESWPREGVDLIVLDQSMPGMSGLEMVRRLRAGHWTTPVILTTGFASPELIDRATRMGVPVLSKPFDLEALTQTALATLVVQTNTEHGPVHHGFKVPS